MTKQKQDFALSLKELADFISAEISINADYTCDLESIKLTAVNTLSSASGSELSFYTNNSYKNDLLSSKAGCVIVHQKNASLVKTIALVVDNPHYAYASAASLFKEKISYYSGIHPSVIIGRNTKIADNVSIGPYVVIGDNCVIDASTIIQSNCSIGNNCHIGHGTQIYSNTTLYNNISIGSNCIIHSGVVLGADGFGFAFSPQKTWRKVEQLGGVTIGNDVEIGANTAIDCGALKDTIIKDGVKLDNHIQIGHNVVIGEHSIFAGKVAVAGSTIIGKHCVFGGDAKVSGHLNIADGVSLAGGAVVARSISEPGVYASGTGTALPFKSWRRMTVCFEQLEQTIKVLKRLVKTKELS